MVARRSSVCTGCGDGKPVGRFYVKNRNGTEWFMDLCRDCAGWIEQGKGINLPAGTRYDRFKVVQLPPQPK